MGYRLLKEKYPEYLKGYSEIKGIYIDGCVNGDPFSKKAIAHVHAGSRFHRDWICLRKLDFLNDKNVLLHELAHIRTPFDRDHGDEWRRELAKLGGTLNATQYMQSYHKNFIRRFISNAFFI